MKVETRQKQRKHLVSFPHLGVVSFLEGGGHILVLFYDKKYGIVIESSSEEYEVGMHVTEFDAFEVGYYLGEVVMSNSEFIYVDKINA